MGNIAYPCPRCGSGMVFYIGIPGHMCLDCEPSVPTVTLEEYQKAQQILKDHRVCGNRGSGCGKLFKIEDTIRTIQYGQEYHWCMKCYEGVKDD